MDHPTANDLAQAQPPATFARRVSDQSGGVPTRIFLRDDDVGDLTPALTDFVGLFCDRGIPVSYQIIPEQFTRRCAEFMLAAQSAHPGMIEFGQHGLRHEMTVRGRRVFREFGPERSFDDQLADIHAGQRLLREQIGDDPPLTVFTPPQHRYNRDTLRALERAGFSVLSASSYPGAAHSAVYAMGGLLGLTTFLRRGISRQGRWRPEARLFEMSIAVAIDNAAAVGGSIDELLARIERARRRRGDVGLMLHHEAYHEPANRKLLEEFADRLLAVPDVEFRLLSKMAPESAAAPRTGRFRP